MEQQTSDKHGQNKDSCFWAEKRVIKSHYRVSVIPSKKQLSSQKSECRHGVRPELSKPHLDHLKDNLIPLDEYSCD